MDEDLMLAAAEPYVTPIAVVDETALLHNIRAMQAVADAAGADLRPHAKSHKSARVARHQLDAGAVGLTVATLREAEYFADNGVDDLLLVHAPMGEPKLRRLQALADRVRRLGVAVDSRDAALGLPPSVEIMWEVDTGGRRMGTLPGTPTADAISSSLESIGSDRFRGLLTHAGHSYNAASEDERRAIAIQEVSLLLETAEILRERAIEVREISVGSTPTAIFAPELGGMTELRPGTYVYGDANQTALGVLRLDDCALAVIATVVSIPAPARLIVDAGNKALAGDSPVMALHGYGRVLGQPDWVVEHLNEEHGIIIGEDLRDTRVGDRLTIVPSHVCTTVNLHGGVLVAFPDGHSEWDHAGARGWQEKTIPRESRGAAVDSAVLDAAPRA